MADRMVAPLSRAQVSGGGAPAQPDQPGARTFGHGAEALADQGGVLELVMSGDPGIPARAFGLGGEANVEVTVDLLSWDIG